MKGPRSVRGGVEGDGECPTGAMGPQHGRGWGCSQLGGEWPWSLKGHQAEI